MKYKIVLQMSETSEKKGNENFMKNKYGKFLTILLVIIALLIVGLLVFFAVDVIRKYNVEGSSDAAIDAFRNTYQGTNSISNSVNNSSIIGNNSNSDSTIINPYNNLVEGNEQNGNSTNTNNGGNNSEGTNYKGYTMLGYIEIPKTKLKSPVLKEYSNSSLEVAVAILTGPGLNKEGNTVIAGHNFRNGTFFSDNAKLSTGDKIYITDTSGKTVTYTIYKKYQATPEDASFMRETSGVAEITLTTCTDDAKNRIIIFAKAD